MDPFKLVHAWEGRPDEYAAYFLYERMQGDGCVDAQGRVELVQRNGMFSQTPTAYTRKALAKFIRPRIINSQHVVKVDCQIHLFTCINFMKEQQIVETKKNRQARLNADITLLNDKEREELGYLNRWLHEKQMSSYFTQFDEYTQEYFIRMYRLVLSDGDAFFAAERDVRDIVGDKLFEALAAKPHH